jgi:hypothetical protein
MPIRLPPRVIAAHWPHLSLSLSLSVCVCVCVCVYVRVWARMHGRIYIYVPEKLAPQSIAYPGLFASPAPPNPQSGCVINNSNSLHSSLSLSLPLSLLTLPEFTSSLIPRNYSWSQHDGLVDFQDLEPRPGQKQQPSISPDLLLARP